MNCKSRIAACACGRLSIEVSGGPVCVFVCHCDYCQRRTGSAFQITTWFRQANVMGINGKYQAFSDSPGSIGVSYCFCESCGSTVFWTYKDVEGFPDKGLHAVAAGCFTDPDFPAPQFEINTAYRLKSVPELGQIPQCSGFPPEDLVAGVLT